MTGITLPDTVNKARDVIMNTRMNVYTPQMNYAQFMADEQNAPSQQNIDNGNAMTYNNTNVNVANNTDLLIKVKSKFLKGQKLYEQKKRMTTKPLSVSFFETAAIHYGFGVV